MTLILKPTQLSKKYFNMKNLYLFLIPVIICIAGCGRSEEKAPASGGFVKNHIGRFRHHDASWIDHSRWFESETPPATASPASETVQSDKK